MGQTQSRACCLNKYLPFLSEITINSYTKCLKNEQTKHDNIKINNGSNLSQ